MTDTTDADVVDILTNDHRQVLDLIATITNTDDSDQQREIADTVIAEIVRHSVAEEMYVYPAMRDHLPDGADEVQHDVEEHQELEETMKALEAATAGDPEFRELVDKLEGQLRHHASDEEKDQFPKLRQALSAEDLHRLGGRVEQAKKLAPTRPHPSSPHAELFHKAFGPGVGFVDKVRDAITGRAKNT